MITINKNANTGDYDIHFEGDTNELIREVQLIVREFAAHNPDVNPDMVALMCGDALAEAVEISGWKHEVADIRGDTE